MVNNIRDKSETIFTICKADTIIEAIAQKVDVGVIAMRLVTKTQRGPRVRKASSAVMVARHVVRVGQTQVGRAGKPPSDATTADLEVVHVGAQARQCRVARPQVERHAHTLAVTRWRVRRQPGRRQQATGARRRCAPISEDVDSGRRKGSATLHGAFSSPVCQGRLSCVGGWRKGRRDVKRPQAVCFCGMVAQRFLRPPAKGFKGRKGV